MAEAEVGDEGLAPLSPLSDDSGTGGEPSTPNRAGKRFKNFISNSRPSPVTALHKNIGMIPPSVAPNLRFDENEEWELNELAARTTSSHPPTTRGTRRQPGPLRSPKRPCTVAVSLTESAMSTLVMTTKVGMLSMIVSARCSWVMVFTPPRLEGSRRQQKSGCRPVSPEIVVLRYFGDPHVSKKVTTLHERIQISSHVVARAEALFEGDAPTPP